MKDVGRAFAAALRRMLKKEKLTIELAARRLGVSRQSFHTYLNGTLPRQKTLNKAVHMWDLTLGVSEYSFDKGAFGQEVQSKTGSIPREPTLWEALDTVSEDDLHVSVKRVGKVLRVHVKIEIPA